MTEIPEHLLKRAAAARAKAAGGAAPADDAAAEAPKADAGDAAPAAVAPAAKAKGPAPLPTLDAEPAKSVPDIAVVAAAKSRKRVPFWAAPVLALLPLWAFIYIFAIRPAPTGETDPLVIGKEVYTANCQSCHQADGSGATTGGSGQQLNDGHAVTTFKDPLAMVHWIAFGATGGARDDGTYGDVDRPGGPMNVGTLGGVMPNFDTTLTPEEIAAVTIFVREEFGGDVYDPEAEQGFTVDGFEADPEGIAKEVEDVIALGEGGDPDLGSVTRAGQ
ncbi:MAG: cytochrome c [Actinobacteria bacterium]|nr:cytochrome c [Actinomycetota bacterium]